MFDGTRFVVERSSITENQENLMLRFANHLSNQVFKETLICGGIDHGTFQRLRGTKSYAVKTQYRHAQCIIDISMFLKGLVISKPVDLVISKSRSQNLNCYIFVLIVNRLIFD